MTIGAFIEIGKISIDMAVTATHTMDIHADISSLPLNPAMWFTP
jgi:hypothetical protein